MDIDIYEYIGYAASIIVAVSMTFNSIVKFRVVNLIGAAVFAIYGLLIDAYPVAVMNGFIVLVDVYYLIIVYSKKQVFEVLDVENNDSFLEKFLNFNHKDIAEIFPEFNFEARSSSINYLVLRNMTVAGVFLGSKEDGETIKVDLDYVTSEYRDYKNGRFVIDALKDNFKSKGYKQVVTRSSGKGHDIYLRKLGFSKVSQDQFSIEL